MDPEEPESEPRETQDTRRAVSGHSASDIYHRSDSHSVTNVDCERYINLSISKIQMNISDGHGRSAAINAHHAQTVVLPRPSVALREQDRSLRSRGGGF